VSFLRRVLGGGSKPADEGRGEAPASGQASVLAAADAEAARERDLLLEEARRLDDDLLQRQLRYADRAWTPPAQGGTRRADDEDAEPER
jgi:hypothetical protein